ncbi:MAG TPA: rod shape-determining protein RodA [Kofleriaceae bacterium]|nr:rod shape-determining protein RodA [Kofleriaceae bacterium]
MSSMPTVGMSFWRRFFAHFDWPLFAIMSLLAFVGLANLYSATQGTVHHVKFDRQLLWMAVGLTAFFLVSALDYRSLHRVAWLALIAVILALLAVDIVGHTSKGAERWLALGGLKIQPSELAKIAVILALARTVSDARCGASPVGHIVLRALFVCVPVVLIALQPDLGSALLVTLIVLSVAALTLPGLWLLVLVGIGGLGLRLIPVLWDHLHEYQQQRWLAFLDPSADPTGAGWHTRQSIFAVGSGRVTGKGFLHATQNQFNFLPEHWTDFPFSVWAEEWGFLGSVVLVGLLWFLILWVINVALKAKDELGGVICIGVAAMLFWHMAVNIAMVLGLAPVVGVTLPLISYGGSSLVTTFVGLGLVSSVSMRRQHF